MKVNIKRYNSEIDVQEIQTYELPFENSTLLEALNYVKIKFDPSLSYSAGCRSGVCGSCGVRVNGTEELACAYKLDDGDLIEPQNNLPVLRDLIVDTEKMMRFTSIAKAWGSENSENILVSEQQVALNEVQSDCIMCGSCFSACPVYAINEDFIGPFALTRSWRYVSDVRENDIQEKIESIQTNGIWDCTLCNECVPVCPQGIAPKQDIAMLRSKAGIMGFMDPNFSSGMSFGGGFGTPDFSGGF